MAQWDTLRSLEYTFGKIPVTIKENVKYLSYRDTSDDFICVPCDRIIQKACSTENTTLNFEKHLFSRTHKNYITTDSELNTNLISTFNGTIPPLVSMNSHTLGINGSNYECVMCDKNIKVSNRDISVTTNNFSYHLLSEGHESKLQDYYETLSQLYEIYGGVPDIVLNHSRFLIKKLNYYLCTICEKQLQIHPNDVDETKKSFEKHLHSLKHVKNAKQAKAFSITPELKQIFSGLPNYMLRNVEYISINGSNFFCSLCNQNIKFNRVNTYETQLNFKVHFSSSLHEEKLNNRRDPENNVFDRLCNIFEDLPDIIQDNVKYLTLNGDDLYCDICEETMTDDEENIKESLGWHFQSAYHHEHVVNSKIQCTETMQDLDEVFGTIPEIIQKNLKHIVYKGGNKFECVLCNEIMKARFDSDYEANTTTTLINFESHLESNGHNNELDEYENIGNSLQTNLFEIFTLIPQFILNNFDYLSNSDDDESFECWLCEKKIVVAPGSKKAEVTEQNFRNHFLSVGHIAKVKNKANLLMEASDHLESIFGKVPDFIVSNIQHIKIEGNCYRCTLCDASIRSIRKNRWSDSIRSEFHKHLFGSRHRSESDAFEKENDEAFYRLDQSFWRIPEFILRNIDFLCTFDDDDLFCILCQEILVLNEDDLEETKQSLRCHMDSERHQFCLSNI